MNYRSPLHIFERKPFHRTYLSELKRAFWILRKKRRSERTAERVQSLYESIYSKSNDEWEREQRAGRYEAIVGNQILTVNGLWFNRIYTCFIDTWIQILDGKKILEVGSGRGDNLIQLSHNNPSNSFTGVEISPQGVARSRERNQSIVFIEGDARKLPFKDNSFDIAFTVQVLESMPRDYAKAVDEMGRVARYGIFVEEFREAQSIADLAWLRFKDRFRYSYKKFNMKPIYFTKDIPHKPKYSLGLYVGEFDAK